MSEEKAEPGLGLTQVDPETKAKLDSTQNLCVESAPAEENEEKPSWLSDLEHLCVYRCSNGHEGAWAGNWDEKPEHLQCDECEEKASYTHFQPVRLGGFQKVAYTQNGRQAYMIKDPATGKIQYRSKTKDHYLESGGQIKDFHTRDYKEKLKNDDAVHTRRANVQQALAKEAWRDAANKAKRNS